MWKKLKNFLYGGVSSLLFSFIYDWVKDKPLLSTAVTCLKWLWKTLINFLALELKVWWLLSIIIIMRIVYLIYKNTNKEAPKPEYINYTSERFKNWIWRWDWYYDAYQKNWLVTNMAAYCPNDDVQLLNKSDMLRQRAVCPKCDTWYGDDYNLPSVEDTAGIKTLIYDKVRKQYNVSLH